MVFAFSNKAGWGIRVIYQFQKLEKWYVCIAEIHNFWNYNIFILNRNTCWVLILMSNEKLNLLYIKSFNNLDNIHMFNFCMYFCFENMHCDRQIHYCKYIHWLIYNKFSLISKTRFMLKVVYKRPCVYFWL